MFTAIPPRLLRYAVRMSLSDPIGLMTNTSFGAEINASPCINAVFFKNDTGMSTAISAL